jgi:hypothetical protein
MERPSIAVNPDKRADSLASGRRKGAPSPMNIFRRGLRWDATKSTLSQSFATLHGVEFQKLQSTLPPHFPNNNDCKGECLARPNSQRERLATGGPRRASLKSLNTTELDASLWDRLQAMRLSGLFAVYRVKL